MSSNLIDDLQSQIEYHLDMAKQHARLAEDIERTLELMTFSNRNQTLKDLPEDTQ